MYQFLHENSDVALNQLPRSASLVNYSSFCQLSEPLVFRSFSIKYVLKGIERYQVNGNNYNVEKNQYLLANSFCEGKVNIDSNNSVKGICIDIAPEILSEVLANHIRPDTPLPDISLDTFFNHADFLENKYASENTALGKVLFDLGSKLSNNPNADHQFTNEFYYLLSEKLIEDHLPVLSQLYSIGAIKHATKKDLYRKLCKGKEYLEGNLSSKITVGDAANYSALSEYHFFRLFKTVFGITPQQYLIQERLLKSMSLLKKGNHSITEISTETGFADVHSFSKAFSKKFGMPPSKLITHKIAGLDK